MSLGPDRPEQNAILYHLTLFYKQKKGEALPLPNISQFFQEQAKWTYNKPNNDYLNHPLASNP